MSNPPSNSNDSNLTNNLYNLVREELNDIKRNTAVNAQAALRDLEPGSKASLEDKALRDWLKQNTANKHDIKAFKSIFDQKDMKGVFRSLKYYLQYTMNKRALSKAHPELAKNPEKLAKAAYDAVSSGSYGLGGLAKTLAIVARFANGATIALSALNFAFKSLGERSKYYDATIRTQQGGLNNISALFEGSTNILQSLRDPRKVGAIFAGSEQFKESFRNLLSSGTFGTGKGPGAVDQLIQSYRYIASQGILLGNTLNDTAKNVADISSIYNLTLGTKDPLKQYAVVNKAIEHGIINGLSQANVLNFYKQYSKSAAVAEKGFLTVTRDLLYGIAAIKVAQGADQAQMQQYFSALQSLTSNRMDFGSWAGLVDRRQVYSKGSLEDAMQRWQDSSVLVQKKEAYSYLAQRTGLGPAAITTLFPQYFQGMDNKAGRELLTALNDPKLYKEFVRDYGNKSIAEQMSYLKGKLKLDKETVDQITNAAQWSELLNNPMKAIVDTLQNIFRLMATAFASPIFSGLSSKVMSIEEAQAYVNSGTKTRSQIGRSSGSGNFGVFSR